MRALALSAGQRPGTERTSTRSPLASNIELNIPSSGAKAGRSVEEGFAGAQREENEVGHRLPQPGKGVPLLDGFARCKSCFASMCLTILNVSSCQKLFSHLDFL